MILPDRGVVDVLAELVRGLSGDAGDDEAARDDATENGKKGDVSQRHNTGLTGLEIISQVRQTFVTVMPVRCR